MCHTITILNDDECEKDPNENFFSDLSYVSGDQPIEINPARAEVVINDIGEPECGKWEIVLSHAVKWSCAC